MALYKGGEIVAGLATNTIVTGFNIFDCKWSDHLLNDIQWLRADTFSWQSGDVYVTAYNTLVSEYNTGSIVTEGGITFKRTTNGYKIADSSQEQSILNKYNADGIAWYYILDTTNKRFKLPRTKFGFEGLRGNAGNDIAESLPNIKSNFTFASNAIYSATGASTISSGTGTSNYGVTGGGNIYNLSTDASRSSSTYKDGAPVQERATQMYLYFYVGEYAKPAIEQTAGITTEQLNNKVDIDSSWGFPSNRYIDLQLGASGTTYTAPANGWFSLGGNDAESGSDFKYVMRINSTRFGVSSTNPSGTTGWMAGVLPVKKGNTVTIYYIGFTSAGVNFKFVYAEGSY